MMPPMPGIPWSRRLFLGDAEEVTPTEAGLYDAAEISTPENAMMLMCVYSRAPAGSTEDVAITTHHFVNYTGGAVDPSWDSGDFTTAEAAFDTFANVIKTYQPNTVALTQYRWYEKSAATETPGTENPPVRVTTKSVTGTGSGSALPPQCAISVTEKTSARKSWGRFYIPSVVHGVLDPPSGRLNTTTVDNLALQAKNLYETLATAELVPIVWSSKHKHGYAVERIQVDNIVDVIRRRRYDTGTYRKSYPV